LHDFDRDVVIVMSVIGRIEVAAMSSVWRLGRGTRFSWVEFKVSTSTFSVNVRRQWLECCAVAVVTSNANVRQVTIAGAPGARRRVNFARRR
jgi:hypothetical protein